MNNKEAPGRRPFTKIMEGLVKAGEGLASRRGSGRGELERMLRVILGVEAREKRVWQMAENENDG